MNNFSIGQEQAIALEITPKMVEDFVLWSGDNAPFHTSDDFAKSNSFKGKIVHGAALFSLVSRFVGVSLPGPDSLWLKAEVKFHNPCYAPAEVTIHGKILMLSKATSSLVLEIHMHDEGKNLLLSMKSYHKIISRGQPNGN